MTAPHLDPRRRGGDGGAAEGDGGVAGVRRIAARYDKLARNVLAAVALASIRPGLRHYESTT